MGSLPPPHAPLRIAVLECGQPTDPIKEKYGGFGQMFEALLQRGAQRVADKTHEPAVEIDVSVFEVVDAEHYPALESVDGVLLTGSKYNAFDNDPWILKLVDFTKQVLAQRRVRLIGVCFGHQIIGRAMGMEVGRNDEGWEIAVVPHTLTAKGKELFDLEELSLHQMHRDIVFQHPPGVEPLAHTPVCAVQGMYVPQRLIAVQGHPEFNGEITAMISEARYAQGIFAQADYEDAMARVYGKHDGDAVAAAFVRFMLEE